MVSDKVVTEEGQLRDYELVLVLNPDLAEEELEAAIGNVSRLITEKGGAISDVKRWGKRKLAYPIRHFIEGNYVLATFKAKSEFGKELEGMLRISEATLRHLLVKSDS